jgi:hypothetical protein
MQIWDIEPKYLSNKDLFIQHRNIHSLFKVIKEGGISNSFKEQKRWEDHLGALSWLHFFVSVELIKRNRQHKSELFSVDVLGNLPEEKIKIAWDFPKPIISIKDQKGMLLKQDFKHYSKFFKN